jgi:hypothetical protein
MQNYWLRADYSPNLYVFLLDSHNHPSVITISITIPCTHDLYQERRKSNGKTYIITGVGLYIYPTSC